MRYVEKAILLQTLDHNWREHIVNLDHLRQYVGLRGYGQRDPLNEYKSEAFELFENLLAKLRSDVIQQVMQVQIQTGAPPPELEPQALPAMQASHIDPLTGEDEFARAPPGSGRWSGQPQQSRHLGQGGSAMRRAHVGLGVNTSIVTGHWFKSAPCGWGKSRC